MNDAAFDDIDQAGDCSSLSLNLDDLSQWLEAERLRNRIEDGPRSTWRCAMGNAYCPAWPGGPVVLVPCFRLELRAIGRSQVTVTPVATAPAVSFCQSDGPYPAEASRELRLDRDPSDALSRVSMFLSQLSAAVEAYRNREA